MDYTQDQLNNIKGTYDSLVNSGSQDWGGVASLMTKYGVGIDGVSKATGISQDQLGTALQRQGGQADGFGGYTNDGDNGWNNQSQQAAAPKMTPEVGAPRNTSTAGKGIISSQMSYPGMTAATVSTPTQWNVNAPQTVQGQMTGLLDMNNPIIQQAMTQAKQQQVANGTLNSSMAATAGLNAAYNTILPIATADAGTNAKAASYNADAQNQVNLANAQLSNTAGQANLSSQTSLQTTGMNNQTQLAQSAIDTQTKTSLQQLANDNQVLLNTNSQAASLFSNATSALNNIAMSTTMDDVHKQQASAQVWGNLQAQIKVLSGTSKLDLSSILGVGTSSNPYITPEPTVDQLKDKTKSPGPGYVWDDGQQSWVKAATTSTPTATNTTDQGGR